MALPQAVEPVFPAMAKRVATKPPSPNIEVAVARFALANPDIEVIIKAKWHGPWEDGVLGFLESDGISIHNVPNLHFNTTADVHSLIKRSRVVIGYGSTTLLESAICGRAVVVPKFGELVDKKFQENIEDC